jgi:hypothetical protein
MKRHIVCIAVAGLFAGCATSAIPENLKVPDQQALLLETAATGVQIYECKPNKNDPAKFEWTFKAPEADLFDVAGYKIGKHYAGPSWESDRDGSKIVGDVKARADAPDPNAIPWLLLGAKATSGNGVFARTVSIQRVNTVDGKAPRDGCSQAQAGAEVRVPYKATYYFYGSKS